MSGFTKPYIDRGKDDLQTRYNVLFELYADHLHEHRLGTGKACEQCRNIINEEIDKKIDEDKNRIIKLQEVCHHKNAVLGFSDGRLIGVHCHDCGKEVPLDNVWGR